MHQVGDLFELNVKPRCQKVKPEIIFQVMKLMRITNTVFCDVTKCSVADRYLAFRQNLLVVLLMMTSRAVSTLAA